MRKFTLPSFPNNNPPEMRSLAHSLFVLFFSLCSSFQVLRTCAQLWKFPFCDFTKVREKPTLVKDKSSAYPHPHTHTLSITFELVLLNRPLLISFCVPRPTRLLQLSYSCWFFFIGLSLRVAHSLGQPTLLAAKWSGVSSMQKPRGRVTKSLALVSFALLDAVADAQPTCSALPVKSAMTEFRFLIYSAPHENK